jgi:hypothetical protein
MQQLNNPNPLAVQGWNSCLQLTTLNLNRLKTFEDMGLEIIVSRSTWLPLPPYQVSWTSTERFKGY